MSLFIVFKQEMEGKTCRLGIGTEPWTTAESRTLYLVEVLEATYEKPCVTVDQKLDVT